MTHVTCRLTAKNQDQLRNPTLGNRVWAAFTYAFCAIMLLVVLQAGHPARKKLIGGMHFFLLYTCGLTVVIK